MQRVVRIFDLRTAIALAMLVLTVLAIDAGSVVLTRMASTDDVRQAGHQAAAIAEGGPSTRQTAVVALAAAREEAKQHDITVSDASFTIYPGGDVTLTGTRTAPTLLMKYFSAFDDLTHVSTTLTVAPLPYD